MAEKLQALGADVTVLNSETEQERETVCV